MKNYMMGKLNITTNDPEWLDEYSKDAPSETYTWSDLESFHASMDGDYLWICSYTHLGETAIRMDFTFHIDTLDEETIDYWLNYDLNGE